MDEFAVLERWLAALRDRLDLDGLADPDWQDLLDTVRLTAHGVIHAAGPVAAFAVGYAAAKGGGAASASASALDAVRGAVEGFDPESAR
ncbi:MAG: DUF6457 domain-containing protein [Propionibacteriaceae bacterium]|jgi:hypothetical protein|nr:DUF6457 domain-containing protein [Propionibacteriaceae bacterium]